MYVKLGGSRCCTCSVVEASGEESMLWVPRHVTSDSSTQVPLIEGIFVLYSITHVYRQSSGLCSREKLQSGNSSRGPRGGTLRDYQGR